MVVVGHIDIARSINRDLRSGENRAVLPLPSALPNSNPDRATLPHLFAAGKNKMPAAGRAARWEGLVGSRRPWSFQPGRFNSEKAISHEKAQKAQRKGRRDGYFGDTTLDSVATSMNAAPLLNSVVAALAEVRLEAILIGNAAAAIQDKAVLDILEKTLREKSQST